MGGEFTYPKMVPLASTHSQMVSTKCQKAHPSPLLSNSSTFWPSAISDFKPCLRQIGKALPFFPTERPLGFYPTLHPSPSPPSPPTLQALVISTDNPLSLPEKNATRTNWSFQCLFCVHKLVKHRRSLPSISSKCQQQIESVILAPLRPPRKSNLMEMWSIILWSIILGS